MDKDDPEKRIADLERQLAASGLDAIPCTARRWATGSTATH
jgi:hypothetical protein